MATPPSEPRLVDVAALAADAALTQIAGAVWSLGSADLNINLMRFADGDGVESHVNAELDVLVVVVAGEGVLDVDGRQERLRPGTLAFIPKGAQRAIHAGAGDFAYLTCHRRRPGLMPTPRREPAS
jgi:quercetin dioxygenase-like cupin family protein